MEASCCHLKRTRYLIEEEGIKPMSFAYESDFLELLTKICCLVKRSKPRCFCMPVHNCCLAISYTLKKAGKDDELERLLELSYPDCWDLLSLIKS
ncbi:hypothetical protein SLA2020_035730 [Shorea laevis]